MSLSPPELANRLDLVGLHTGSRSRSRSPKTCSKKSISNSTGTLTTRVLFGRSMANLYRGSQEVVTEKSGSYQRHSSMEKSILSTLKWPAMACSAIRRAETQSSLLIPIDIFSFRQRTSLPSIWKQERSLSISGLLEVRAGVYIRRRSF